MNNVASLPALRGLPTFPSRPVRETSDRGVERRPVPRRDRRRRSRKRTFLHRSTGDRRTVLRVVAIAFFNVIFLVRTSLLTDA